MGRKTFIVAREVKREKGGKEEAVVIIILIIILTSNLIHPLITLLLILLTCVFVVVGGGREGRKEVGVEEKPFQFFSFVKGGGKSGELVEREIQVRQRREEGEEVVL